jgi:hypothetical protein
MSGPGTIRVWADTVRPAKCRSEHCGASIEFAETVKNGKAMPFDAPIVALQTETDGGTGRAIYVVDFATSHFKTCPDANRFSGSAKR